MKKSKLKIEDLFFLAQKIKSGSIKRKTVKRGSKLLQDNPKVTFDKVRKTEADLLKKRHSVNVKDFKRVIDLDGVLHVLKKHPNMSVSDFLIIAKIINECDVCGLGKYPETIVYKKTLADEYFYIEFIQYGRKELILKTYYKRKSRQK
jgi:hypothetical protein